MTIRVLCPKCGSTIRVRVEGSSIKQRNCRNGCNVGRYADAVKVREAIVAQTEAE